MENRFLFKALFLITFTTMLFVFLKSSSNQKTPDKNEINLYDLQIKNLKIQRFYESIKEMKKFSQNKEDGVILSLLGLLSIPKEGGTYVEFGTESGKECNTRYLRESLNWSGILMDGSNKNSKINLYKEKIHYSNIIELFEKYQVKIDLDIFSEDTDYADYWIVQKVLTKYQPKIIIHEVNQQSPELCVTVAKPKVDEYIFWDGSSYHGGSVCAFYCLAKSFNYTMVKFKFNS